MQRKLVTIFCAIGILLSFNQAFAQSSHDALVGDDADLKDTRSGKFEIASADGKYRLGIRGHVQENNQLILRRGAGKWDPSFKLELNRARLALYGNALDPRLTYLFQVGLEREPGPAASRNARRAPGTDYLKDYYLNFAWLEDYFHVRIGKFTGPFSRHAIMSSSQTQFYDPSDASKNFQLTEDGRDVGIMFHNGFNQPIEWAAAAISNGGIVRVGYNYNDIDGYDHVDFSGREFRFSVAGNGFIHTDYKTARLDDIRAGADFIAKVHNFSTNAAFYYQWAKRVGQTEGTNRFGAGLDAGYLIRNAYEPVLRYSWSKLGQPNDHEVLAGFNYYIYGHHLKVQGYAGTNLSDSNINKWLGGVQFQFAL